MKNFTRYSALFLLMLFVRVLTPNELLLNLHAHEHTVETPLQDESKPHIGKKHTHCHTDDLFHAPFQLAEAVSLPTPVTYQVQFGVQEIQMGHALSGSHQFLRGPPHFSIS